MLATEQEIPRPQKPELSMSKTNFLEDELAPLTRCDVRFEPAISETWSSKSHSRRSCSGTL